MEHERDIPIFGVDMLATVEDEDFRTVQRGAKPRPHKITLGSFMSKNHFEALNEPEEVPGHMDMPLTSGSGASSSKACLQQHAGRRLCRAGRG